MTAEEVIARAICKYDGIDPDGLASHHYPERNWQQFRDVAIPVLRALESSGYRVVPREPTEAMIEAGLDYRPISAYDNARDCWRAMLDAAGRSTTPGVAEEAKGPESGV